jgi:hypothetical protein
MLGLTGKLNFTASDLDVLKKLEKKVNADIIRDVLVKIIKNEPLADPIDPTIKNFSESIASQVILYAAMFKLTPEQAMAHIFLIGMEFGVEMGKEQMKTGNVVTDLDEDVPDEIPRLKEQEKTWFRQN